MKFSLESYISKFENAKEKCNKLCHKQYKLIKLKHRKKAAEKINSIPATNGTISSCLI